MPSKGAKSKPSEPTTVAEKAVVNPPPYWSHNWTRNFHRIKEYATVVCEMCTVSSVDYDCIQKKKIHCMSNDSCRDILANYVCNMSLLLEWIDHGIVHINLCEAVPESCVLKTYDMILSNDAWSHHILVERTEIPVLISKCQALISEIEQKLKAFLCESEIEYSSYSDYSESSYDSEEEEEEELEDDDNVSKGAPSDSQPSVDVAPRRRRRR